MDILEANWGIVLRNTHRARRRFLSPEWFRTHAVIEPRPFGRDAPPAEPSDDEDLPALPEDSKRSDDFLGGMPSLHLLVFIYLFVHSSIHFFVSI